MAFRDLAATEEAKIGAIVEVSRTPSQRPADRNIAIVATGTGVYRPSAHRKMLEAASARVRGGDYEAFVDTHVRRLEALRRAGIVERASADCWLIPENFEVRATAYDAGRGRTTSIRLLSGCKLPLNGLAQHFVSENEISFFKKSGLALRAAKSEGSADPFRFPCRTILLLLTFLTLLDLLIDTQHGGRRTFQIS